MALEAKLLVVEGFLREKIIPLPPDGTFVIGRDRDCQLCILNRLVSRRHAQITGRGGAYALADLESKAGTVVNGNSVTQTPLRQNDMIQIGDVKLRFVIERGEKEEALNAAPPAKARPIITPPRPLISVAPVIPSAPPPVQTAPEASAFPPIVQLPPEEMALVGSVIGGVKLLAPIGRSRRTIIFKGTQASHNRVVALRLLTAETAKDPAIVRWLVSGAQAAAELKHEDVLSPTGGGVEDGRVFVFSRFMDRGSAEYEFTAVVREGVPAVKRALDTLVRLVRALEFGQSKGVLHLGMRPSKVLYDENRNARLSGLGFDNTAVAPGAALTPDVQAFIAPEQVFGEGPAGIATDIFSLGATFYFLLTGRRPDRARRQRIASPQLVNKAVPDSLCRIIEKMVEPDPGGRYRTYAQLLHDLRWALRGEVKLETEN